MSDDDKFKRLSPPRPAEFEREQLGRGQRQAELERGKEILRELGIISTRDPNPQTNPQTRPQTQEEVIDRWEYKHVRSPSLEEFNEQCNQLGSDGWELVNFYYGELLEDLDEKQGELSRCYKGILKRKL